VDAHAADLVVDASGRGSRTPEWLEALGYPRPAETVVDASLGYTSRIYRRPADFDADWQSLYVQAMPPEVTRGGIIYPLEGDRWMVTLGGGDRDWAPTDEEGFLAFARGLPSPAIAEAIERAEPLSPITRYRATENRWRHYERLARRPERLVVLGDAVCAFNPVYGQGMTTGALAAAALGECLSAQRRRHPDGDLTGLAGRFQSKLARQNAGPWALATGEDFRFRQTTGGKPGRSTRFLHLYVDYLAEMGTTRAIPRLALLEVLHLLKPSWTLFHPRFLLPILAKMVRRQRPARFAETAAHTPPSAGVRPVPGATGLVHTAA
jgi:2-polyprenyl-6-methoxyphenol hydroxylase-like FAD-dependent oxidoreductase